MGGKAKKHIWTIGHSTRTFEAFVEMLNAFRIEMLVDIRNFPGSRRYPHFSKTNLEAALPQQGIRYHHLEALGGRRRPAKDSENTAWRVEAFRGYADYMETETFRDAAAGLEKLGTEFRVAYMCSEAVWWSCHRALVSDYLKSRGWTVMHIMGTGKAEEHPYTSPARIVGGKLVYH